MKKQESKVKSETTVTVYFQSPIGLIEITGDRHRVYSVDFADRREIKKHPSPVPRIIQQCEKQLTEYFEGKRKVFSLHTEQEGTDFQKKTWEFISEIPFGKTVSYLDLAKKHWDKNSIRAVGNAVGKNKLAIVVPCHRVIGTNGKLVGYSGGLWRKEWLLRHEEKIAFGMKELFDGK